MVKFLIIIFKVMINQICDDVGLGVSKVDYLDSKMIIVKVSEEDKVQYMNKID